MASSLIRINEATAEELCHLPLIDPDLAARIIRYRDAGNLIRSPADLARAADINPLDATHIGSGIDWQATGNPTLPLMLALVACAGFFGYAISTAGLETTRPATILFNTSVILILLGCLLATARVVLGAAPKVSAPITLAGLSVWLSGMALLLALIVATAIIDADDAFAVHVLGGGKFVAFIVVVLALLYGPALVAARTASWYRWAAIFDISQALLAPLAALTLEFDNHENLVDAIFGLWLGVILIHNGLTMHRGQSSFVAAVSDETHRKVIDASSKYYPVSNTLLRRTGTVTLVMGGTLIAFVVVQVIGG